MYIPRTSIPKLSRKAKKERASKESVKVFPGGREVCQRNPGGHREYQNRLCDMVERQNDRCAICLKRFTEFLLPTFEHQDGRGSNGGHRDDRIWLADGTPFNAALCSTCNTAKGSRRYHWIEGAFIPAVYLSVDEWIAAEGK